MNKIKLSLVAALLATTGIVSTVSADEVEVSANVSLTNNYVWRGQTQTDSSPAIQGGIDLAYGGLYAGVWGSNISWTNDNESSLEADLYAGYAGGSGDFSYDVGFVAYTYANVTSANNFGELYLGLGYDFGVASVGVTYSAGVSIGDWDDIPDNIELSASIPVTSDIALDLAYGMYDTVGDYYSIGTGKSYGKFDYSVVYSNFTRDASTYEEDNVVVAVGTSF